MFYHNRDTNVRTNKIIIRGEKIGNKAKSSKIAYCIIKGNYKKALKKKTPNASKFIDNILNIVREGIWLVTVVISPLEAGRGAGVAESGKGARLRV